MVGPIETALRNSLSKRSSETLTYPNTENIIFIIDYPLGMDGPCLCWCGGDLVDNGGGGGLVLYNSTGSGGCGTLDDAPQVARGGRGSAATSVPSQTAKQAEGYIYQRNSDIPANIESGTAHSQVLPASEAEKRRWRWWQVFGLCRELATSTGSPRRFTPTTAPLLPTALLSSFLGLAWSRTG